MRRAAAALGSLCLALSARVAADPTPVHAGPQQAPPVRAGEPVLPQQLDGRRSVRGCSVDETCGRAAEVLREFQLEAMPPPGGDPWIGERTPPRSRLEAGPVRVVKKPSELRPDAPWLDALELPDLPVRWTQRLADFLVFYRDDPRGHAIIESWIAAQGRYRDLILTYLRKAKLPEDLLYVAMIESSYDPNTLSRAGALGLWQWMPEGAKIYGLRRDRWVDERRDPYRSTIAQMDYFQDLYQRFGDWDIALGAFNVGYGAVLRSIARYNSNDYYQLCEYENGLPWETCWYTPKVLATAIVGRNRAAFNLDKVKVAAPEVWDEVAVPVSISLGVIARAAGANEAELARLNPHLRHGRTPPGEPGYLVRVPAGKKAETQRRIAELQSDWDGFDAYVVAHGERFEDVATTYGMTTQALRRLNEVASEAEIEGGTVLVVPRISEDQRVKNRAKAKANLHASGIDQKGGEPLVVPVPDKDAVVTGKQRVFYRVVAGDSLREVAQAFGVAPDELAQWNALDADSNLQPRMVLVAWVAPDFDAERHHLSLLEPSQLVVVTRGSPEHMDLAEARMGRVRTEYVAQGKEKLDDIAKKFGMGSHDLARINRISYDKVLAKGDKIIVYQVTDPGRSARAEEQWKKTPKARRGKVSGSRAQTSSSVERDDDGDDDARPSKATAEATEEKPARSEAKTEDKKPARSEAKAEDKKPSRSETKAEDKKPARSETKAEDKKPSRSETKAEDRKPARSETKAEDRKPARSEAKAEDKKPARTEVKTEAKTEDRKPVRPEVKPEPKAADRKPAVDAMPVEEPGPEPPDRGGPVTKPTQVD